MHHYFFAPLFEAENFPPSGRPFQMPQIPPRSSGAAFEECLILAQQASPALAKPSEKVTQPRDEKGKHGKVGAVLSVVPKESGPDS
jgi:hypothetical protein